MPAEGEEDQLVSELLVMPATELRKMVLEMGAGELSGPHIPVEIDGLEQLVYVLEDIWDMKRPHRSSPLDVERSLDRYGLGLPFGTVTVGYDHQFSGHWVAGLFADYDFGNGKNDHHIQEIGNLYNIHHSSENKHAWSIGGRIGFLSSPSTLLFLSTGWTQVSFDRDIQFTWYDTQHRRSFNNERDGWFIGAGMETQLGWLHSGLSLRGEYRYTRLDDENRRHDLGEGGVCYDCVSMRNRLKLDHDVDVHSLRVVLAYKFGHRQAVAPLK